MNKDYGYFRVAAAVPEIKVGNVLFNTKEIIKLVKQASNEGAKIILFPELSLTGYTCGDLFFQDTLMEQVNASLLNLLNEISTLDITIIIGLPILCDNQLFNCAAVLQNGKILGVVPKIYLPNYNEFYEKRWFSSGKKLVSKNITILGQEVPIGVNLLFRDIDNMSICFGIELCEDMWSPKSPSVDACLNGATLIFNLSASNEVIGKNDYRKKIISIQSAKNICAYIYASAGVNESSTDLVFSGYAGIYENGSCLIENERFSFKSNLIMQDVDIQRLMNNRIKNKSFMDVEATDSYRMIDIKADDENNNLLRHYDMYPFVPNDENLRKARCEEIINIQACGLAKRLKHTGLKKCIIGISGGLDSTLAFLVTIEAYRKLGISNDNIIGITMPGFGTTGRTYNNALQLMKKYGVTIQEISIKEASLQHFKDISLPLEDRSITYENTQARERTQILMDVANKENGLVIGTGDLSELILGWCTYNGDHMSMYAINSSIPKTLVRYLVEYFALKENDDECKKTILDILDTPISPELLPPDKKDNIKQHTELVVGPYVLHDFFIYHFMRYGASIKKIKYLACHTFKGMYNEKEIDKWLKFFVKRFFSQQFKRSCLPDGPKVGTISVSPRGDLRMPSDADGSTWLEF